jgi:hypothetical protein
MTGNCGSANIGKVPQIQELYLKMTPNNNGPKKLRGFELQNQVLKMSEITKYKYCWKKVSSHTFKGNKYLGTWSIITDVTLEVRTSDTSPIANVGNCASAKLQSMRIAPWKQKKNV